MKKVNLLKAAGILVLSLCMTACNAETGNASVIDTSLTNSTDIINDDIKNTASETAPVVATETALSATNEVTQVTTAPVTESQTVATTTQIEIITNETTTEAQENDIDEAEEIIAEMPEDWNTDILTTPNGSTIYNDTKRYEKYIIVNVTPQNIYWNKLEDYDIAEGEPIDVPIPVIFDDFLAGADEVMIYMTKGWNLFGDISLDNGNTLKGMTYSQYWSRDYLCPIVDGTVQFREYSDEIIRSFTRVDDGIYIEMANYYTKYMDNPFEDGMSASDMDAYFEKIYADSAAIEKTQNENPDVMYDTDPLYSYQNGVRFRAKINYIH